MTAPLTREELEGKVEDVISSITTSSVDQGYNGVRDIQTIVIGKRKAKQAVLQLIDTYTQQQWETQEAIRKDQLARAEKIVQAKVLEARAEELGAAYAGLMNEPEHRLVVVIHQMKDRLADLQKQLEEEK